MSWHYHERYHRPHGQEPALDPLDPGDDEGGRLGIGGWQPRKANVPTVLEGEVIVTM